MNSTKLPRALATAQPFNRQAGETPPLKPAIQLKIGVNAQSARRPIAPPVYKPQVQPKLAQAKMAVAPAKPSAFGQRIKRPVAPPAFRPQARAGSVQAKTDHGVRPTVLFGKHVLAGAGAHGLALRLQRSIQCSSKGTPGGKGGVGYGQLLLHYSQEEIDKALSDLGLKGVKGHKLGASGSGESGQTTKEMQLLVEQLQKNRESSKEKTKQCNLFHKKKNNGNLCPTCGDEVAV